MADAVANPSPEVYETAFEAFGVRVGVTTNDSRWLDRLSHLAPARSHPCDPANLDHHFTLSTEDGVTFTLRYDIRDAVELVSYDSTSWIATDVDAELALGLIDTHVHGAIALRAPNHIFVGAGVVAHRDRAIVLPGPALSGKTTLVGALVAAGCTYYSDDFAVLDGDGLVHPYVRPQSPAFQRTPEDQRDAVPDAPGIPLGMVVSTVFRPDVQWAPRRLSAGEGLLALLAHTVPAMYREDEVMRVLKRALESRPLLLAGDRGEADAVAPQLVAELEQALAERA